MEQKRLGYIVLSMRLFFFYHQVPIYGTQLYDSIVFYANTVSQMLRDKKDYKNGRKVQQEFRNKFQTGK